MFQKFYPDLYVSSTYEIDFDRLYRSGYRGLIFDIDNTLVTHGAPANDQAKQLFAHLHEIGFATCLISKGNTVFIGDQMFTDVFGANRTGIPSIMVKKIHWKEEIQIVLKRRLEAIVLIGYRRYRKTHKSILE